MNYTIGEFSKLCNISIYTLRYYEKESLVHPDRQNNGRRCYSDADVKWIEFIKRLKDTGMPIKGIQTYAFLRANGNSTLTKRMNMLINHKTHLEAEIAAFNEHLCKLNKKIEHYRQDIENYNQSQMDTKK